MEIKLKKIAEGSPEAELMSLAVRFYDYYSIPSKDDSYWDELIDNARKVCEKFNGTELRIPAAKIMLGMCDALEEKYKERIK